MSRSDAVDRLSARTSHRVSVSLLFFVGFFCLLVGRFVCLFVAFLRGATSRQRPNDDDDDDDDDEEEEEEEEETNDGE